MCKVLSVSSSGYYEWRKPETSKRESEDQHLIDFIRVLHAESFGAYGIRRIVRELKHKGIVVNPKKIRRLMASIGLSGNEISPNHLGRQFVVSEPNCKWTSDITYIWTEEGWLYLAVVIDLFSRMIVGWAVSSRITASLVCMALEKAIIKRKPSWGLCVHFDPGVQYISRQYRILLSQHGILQSMSRKGNCWDNAVAESFFRSLKVEAIKGYKFMTRKEAEWRIFDYIEGFYNLKRAHSFLLYKSPVQWAFDVKINPNLLGLRQNSFK